MLPHLSVFLFSLALLCTACSPPFPEKTLDTINKNLSFRAVWNTPEKFAGEWVLFGGVIIASKNTREGTILEILQKPTDYKGRPLDTDASEGRFLVQSSNFLDTALYQKGRLITIVGEVLGSKELPLDEVMYRYPLLALKDHHLWKPSYQGPRFFFGIGISHHI